MTVNEYIRVISSSLTPGFDPLYTRNYFERFTVSFTWKEQPDVKERT